jgi:hypothetical protein
MLSNNSYLYLKQLLLHSSNKIKKYIKFQIFEKLKNKMKY